jgi:hypothetical protein
MFLHCFLIMKSVFAVVLVLACFLLAGCVQPGPVPEPRTIDYSCNTASDCEIKDIGNQCGYYPACVNKAFEPRPPELDSMVCGFPSITQCRCVQSQCVGITEGELEAETACENDNDCACGTHIETGDCFTGNKAFVNIEVQCPDFCTGIAANFETKCVQGTCKNVNILQENPVVDSSTFLQGVECDATRQCPQGYDCSTFPGIGTACHPAGQNPCSLVLCPPGETCAVAESYPVQAICG